MTKEDYVMFAVFNILFFQGIPQPWQTKRTVFRDRPFPIIVVNKSTRRVPLYINLIGINVIIIIIIIILDRDESRLQKVLPFGIVYVKAYS